MINLSIFTVILVVAIFLRFYNLKNRGIMFWDDGVRLDHVIFLEDMVNYLKNNLKKILNREVDFKDVAEKFRGKNISTGHYLHVFFDWIFGKIWKDFVFGALFAHAFFGVLSVVGVFLLSRLMFDTKTALLAMFVIAISGYHIMYSRSIHPGSICGAFYIGATYFYVLSLNGNKDIAMLYLAICGLLIGFGFIANTRHFYIPVFFMFFELVVFLSQISFLVVSRLIVLGTLMILPLIALESIFVILKEFGYPYPTFFKTLFYDAGFNTSYPSLKFPFLKMHFENFIYLDGLIVFLTIAGSFFMARNYYVKREIVYLIMLIQFWVPLLFWSSRAYKTGDDKVSERMTNWVNSPPRLMSSSLFSMAIISAAGLSFLNGKLLYAVILVMFVSRINVFTRFLKMCSGFVKAIGYILSQDKTGRHLSVSSDVSLFYVGKENVIPASSPLLDTMEGLKKLYKDGFRFLLYIKMIHVNSLENKLPASINTILNIMKPAYSVPAGLGDFKPLIRDDQNIRDIAFVKENNIDIYDLKEYFKE